MILKGFHVKKLKTVDISSALSFVEQLNQKVWNVETQRRKNNFDVFHSVEHIVFRIWLNNNQDPQAFEEYPIWKFSKRIFMPIIQNVLNCYDYVDPVIPVIMLAKLKAGAHIDEHVDLGERFHLTHKIHVPLITNQRVKFLSKERDITFN